MALIQWKQIDSYLSGSKELTGSLAVSGALDLDGPFTVQGEEFINGIFVETGSFYSTTNDIKVTGSFDLNLDGVSDYFAISINGEEKIKVNNEGVLEMKSQDSTPTAVSGGMFYSGSNEFFLGFKN
jgi:hypothetical protein